MASSYSQFFITLDSADDLHKVFERDDGEVGRFFKTSHRLEVGERVMLIVAVKGVNAHVFFEGKVVWHRARPGGPKMPAGVFVGLVERDRARLEGVAKYLKAPSRNERRRHKRFPVDMGATYSTSKGRFHSEVSNLSKGGAFLRCMGPLLTVGAKFPLAIYPDRNKEKSKKVSVDVRVAWIDYFEETQGMGVMFEGGQSQLRKIKRLIDGYEKDLKKSKSSSI